jgi:hypothetical protein
MYKHILYTDNEQITSIPLNRQLMQYYISNNKLHTYNPTILELSKNNVSLADINTNWRKKKKYFILDNDENTLAKIKLTKTTKKTLKHFINAEILPHSEQSKSEEQYTTFNSDVKQYITLQCNIKNNKKSELQSTQKPIYINSLNLQLLKYICKRLSNTQDNNQLLIDILVNDLLGNNKFTFNIDIKDSNIKIIGIPNVLSTLLFLINKNIEDIKKVSNYDTINKFREEDYKTGYFKDNIKYLKSLLKLYKETDEEYKLNLSIIDAYKTDIHTSDKEKILQLPCSSMHYIFFVIKKEEETYKPYKYTFRELNSGDKLLLEKIEELSKQIYTKIYKEDTILYNNYYSYVEYNDIFCVNVKINYPYDNEKIFYYLNSTSIQLTELLQCLDVISTVKITIDLNESYLSEDYKKFDFESFTLSKNNNTSQFKSQSPYFNKQAQIIIFNSSKWSEYDIIYFLEGKYYYIKFISIVNSNNTFYKVLEELHDDEVTKKIIGFTENLPLYKFNMTSTDILRPFKNKFYVYIINFYIKYYLRYKDKFNTSRNNSFSINNNLPIGQLKSDISLNVQSFDYIKVEEGDIIIFIQKNKSGGISERILVWVLKKSLIDYIETNKDIIDLHKLIIHIPEDKLNDLFDLTLDNLNNIKVALSKVGITNDKYFIYFNIFNKLVTMTPHIHILKKTNSLYFNPRFGLDMYVMDYQKGYSLDKAINFLNSNPEHLSLVKKNLNILQIDNMDITYLPIQQSHVVIGGSINNKKKTKKITRHKINNKLKNNINITKTKKKRRNKK